MVRQSEKQLGMPINIGKMLRNNWDRLRNDQEMLRNNVEI